MNMIKQLITQNTPLLQVITEISEVEGLERIRLGSLEPRIITDEFVKTLSKNKKFCPHFHYHFKVVVIQP